jgi:tetratricopeptide (TPR) repeat protein
VTTIYTNRALCYLKLELWDRVLRDCKLALEIDKMMTKAHFFMGQALTELGKFDEAIASYTTGSLNIMNFDDVKSYFQFFRNFIIFILFW